MELALDGSVCSKLPGTNEKSQLSSYLISVFKLLLYRITLEENLLIGILKHTADNNFANIYNLKTDFSAFRNFSQLLLDLSSRVRKLELSASRLPIKELQHNLQVIALY